MCDLTQSQDVYAKKRKAREVCGLAYGPLVGFRENVRAARVRAGLSLNAAGKAAGLTATQVKEIEDGKNANPGLATIEKLAEAIHASPVELLGVAVLPPGANHDAGRPEHTVPIPVVGVAAGGKPIESEELHEEYPLLRHLYKSGRYAIRLFGDSMWPTLWDRDLLLVEPSASVPNGKIAVVRVNGESTVKRVHRRKKDGSWTLKSDNPTHPLLEAEADEVEVLARFLKIVEGERP